MKGFTAKQEKALSALLIENTMKNAAQIAGVAESTLWRWLKDVDFEAEYKRLRREAVNQSFSQLQTATSEAVQTLRNNLNADAPAVQVRAAQIIIEQAVKSIELQDLAERLEIVERELADKSEKD